MAAERPSSSSSSGGNNERVTSLGPHDVLSGRGSAANEWIGNQSYRNLVDTRRHEYMQASHHTQKTKVAESIYHQIKGRGGRFLTRVGITESFVIEDGDWVEVSQETAVEKVKQALRQNRPPPKGRRRSANAALTEESGFPLGAAGLVSSDTSHISPGNHVAYFGHATSMPILPPMLVGSGMPPVDARLLLYQRRPFHHQAMITHAAHRSGGVVLPDAYTMQQGYDTMQPPHYLPRNTDAAVPYAMQQGYDTMQPPHYLPRNTDAAVPSRQLSAAAGLHVENSAMHYRSLPVTETVVSSGVRNNGLIGGHADTASVNEADNSAAEIGASAWEVGSSEWATDEEVSDFLLASLGWDSNHPRFTEEQFEQEQASLSTEERSSALVDLFGRACSVSDHRQGKRARKDLDEEAIGFLVKQMKIEIEKIPEDKKQALVEARKKCRAEEFCDERLVQFLRCEGMNPKFGAQRFVNYWEARRELFGPEKYFLRMSLSEAARDDVAALEAGVYRLLPGPDLSGRPLLYMDSARNNGEGYTPESLLRAVWYTWEIAAKHTRSDFVFIGWYKNTTVWDFSANVHGRLAYYERSCLPIKAVGCHVCCTPSVLLGVMKPILSALLDSRGRSRMIIHDVPDSKIVEDLSRYGIQKEMLPTEMGGSYEFNAYEWIANRRAAELEEIG